MSIQIPSLQAALAAIGNAWVFISPDFESGTWEALGAKEGPIEANVEYRENNLTAEELTGGVVHQQLVQLESVTITVPLIAAEDLEAQIARISPVGDSGGGWSSWQEPTEWTVAIVPQAEVGAGLTYDGATWSPGAPKAAFWLWRATIRHGAISYAFENGGKVIIPVTITGMYYGANPEGHKIYTVGNPVTAGITTLLINADES
jgi:hypothetical protein